MSETAPQFQSPEVTQIQDKELAYIGAVLTEAAMRQDLAQVSEVHALSTGVANPNSYLPNQFRIGDPAVPESSDNVYRQVNQDALYDLAESGVVRGARTAGSSNKKTSGHTAYWNTGETGQFATLGQGFVIEAPKQAVEDGWVTADKVTGVYARDVDGAVNNIMTSRGSQAAR